MEKFANQLLCVTGLTPQVVTETLYAIHNSHESMPDTLHVLTTAEGANRARLTLINDQWLQRFYRDYQLPEPQDIQIHVLKDNDGNPLQDIRSQQQNLAMADSITEKIRQMTQDPQTGLHVSIAGGRKTMGFYAGYALSLYGRPQDRLSHVLVSADYESHPQFYYPTPYSQVIYGNDPSRKPLDTQHAQVTLADIAFVRLRHGLDENLLHGKTSFSSTVEHAQQAFSPAKLIIDKEQGQIQAHGKIIHLSPADMAFYCWLIMRQIQNQPYPGCPAEGAPEEEYAREYIEYYRSITDESGGFDRTIKTLHKGMSKSFFEQRKSRINATLKKHLPLAAQYYQITATGKRPATRYKIPLTPDQISFQQEAKP